MPFGSVFLWSSTVVFITWWALYSLVLGRITTGDLSVIPKTVLQLTFMSPRRGAGLVRLFLPLSVLFLLTSLS